MRVRPLAALASFIAITAGLVTFLGLIVGDDLYQLSAIVEQGGLRSVADALVQIVTITVALTILIGILNLLAVHLRRVFGRHTGWVYSIVLILSFALVVATYAVRRDVSMVLLETVQISVESALAGLVVFALVYGAYRMLHRRVTWSNTLFVVVVLLVLIAALPFSNTGLDAIKTMRDWLMAIPVSAGSRGILLGIALATVVTGVRVLVGVDRSYRE